MIQQSAVLQNAVSNQSDSLLSLPAVSLIYSVTIVPSIFTSFLLKYAPIVGLMSSVKREFIEQYIYIKEVFPTPESPITITFSSLLICVAVVFYL